ncbi:hypothetical protein BHE90_001203 [Fusarium euwallaceae]|uniref:S-adenosyl-L-methionine-dependent N-methyltransferase n=2 Tax=Fusarium solani species complex TaxID=232080 RepID=A0A430M8M8_9HYPO|nr:hypothetical protein CEP51_011760 [Fusarium floridanum]RTE84310.1 hypothetical protein BHE90_001203 [Fusarium euwallaceae]
MNDMASKSQPPITRLRPLHSRQQLATLEPETSGDEPQLLQWASSIEPRPSHETAVKAFVELVSRIVVLDVDEEFCIQDSPRGGYILARFGHDTNQAFEFIECADVDDIPTDFSIGKGKALQLHTDATTGQVGLTAQANVIPEVALESLGRMLDDFILGLQGEWTQPSVLNFPPRSSPLPLSAEEPAGPALLHRWFEQRAAEYPQRTALDFPVSLESGKRIQYTYQQVENVANSLAADLIARSQPSARTVAVMIGPCPELYISYLAVLKAGMAFCPIPVDAPEERKEVLLEDLKPAAVLVATSAQLVSERVTTISVTPYLAACNTISERQPASVKETDPAYILYTSGTTGLPKGVVVSHISAACTISSLSAHYGFPSPTSEPIRWFQGAAPTFDISLFEIFWTLSSGSTLCCAPRESTLQDIDKTVTTLQADMTNITPSFANLLDPASIHGLMVGGETLNARLLQDFARYNPTEKLASKPSGIYNGYGPTETAIYCIAQAHVPGDQRGSVLGTPLATCGTLIVDEQSTALNPVPMGAIGELVITGPQVSREGYLNRPEETSRAFVDDERWGRAYRTGDRARIVWDPSGQPVVEFLGRISDDQVKLSGRRVELGEIDSVLASRVDEVREVLSCVWKQETSGAGSEKVVSLVVCTELDFELVRQKCLEAAERYLPDYMRPFKILRVDALPKSASGKADRKAASAYVQETLKQDQVSQQPEPAQEEPLADLQDAKLENELLSIVSEILGDNSVAITATTLLADAGMDSLRAMRLLRDIRKKWPGSGSTEQLQPSLASLLDSGATIRSVFFPSSPYVDGSDGIKRQLADFSSRHLPEALQKLNIVNEADVEMVLPATCTQSQLAVSMVMDKRSYISHSVLKLKPDVSPEALKRAVEAVMTEQAIYRCAMIPCDDSLSPFAQVILTPEAWRERISNANQVVHERASVVGDVKAWLDLAEENISLDSQRLYHAQIIEPESDCGLLIISVAHCICDGASLEALMSDIAGRYAGLEPLSRQGIYEAVLEWMSNVDPKTDDMWRELVKDWETESFDALSGNGPKASESEHGMVQHSSNLSWQTLEDKSRALGASPLSILQASWSLLLQLFSEADTGDVVFGSVISGSHLPSHAPTFSVVPCRVALPETQTINDLVKSLASSSRIAQSHRHTSFGIFKTLPYSTALALQAYSQTDREDVTVPWSEIQNPAIRYDFAMFAEVLPYSQGEVDNMTFKLTYRGDSLSEPSATCIVRQFAALTEAMLSSLPEDMVQKLPVRLPRGLLSAEGTVPAAKPEGINDRTELLHHQFESQAASTPDRLAVSFYTSLDSPPIELSYAELDARANGLANVLREEDVDIIPICMHRSVELYVAILAILKAGSAWCPIDETSPVQRRTSLIARTQSKVLLTTTESLHLVQPCLDHESLEGVRIILLDQYADHKSSTRPDPRRSVMSSGALSGKDLAYLLWTSGTTGEPKGVMIQHSAASEAMRDLQVQVDHDDKTEQVRTLQFSSYSFDVFVQDLFYTWGLAGSIISGTRELMLGTFVDFIWKSRPTHAHLTPSFGASIDVEEIRGSTLQYVTFIGEKLTEDVAEAWAAPGITTRAYNTYGPAENAVVSTLRQFYGRSRDQAKAANVGFPLTNCTAYVVREVDNRWELVPRYGVGELALGGAQVAKGYLSNEAKTAKAFIQGGPGIDERIYLTGDMVRLNDHGFEFLGRNDDLIKITGIRIELSEISAACASVRDEEPAVEHVETLYLPRPGDNSNNKVVVTFVSVKRAAVDTSKIRVQVFQRARDVLPTYMVPGHVVVLETTMPRTASNKVDRKALQKIYEESDPSVLVARDGPAKPDGQETKPQWTEAQLPVLQTIADHFQVAVEGLAPDDSLASLGFSSLQVTKLAWSLRRQLDRPVGVLDLMRCRYLGELVDVVVGKQQDQPEHPNGAESPDPPSWLTPIKDALTSRLRGDMRPQDTLYILPATPVQESLIVETMLEPKAYWAHRVFDLSHLGEIDGDRLKKAWIETARRFDILRTIFVPLTQLSTEDHSNIVTWSSQLGIQSKILQIVRREPIVGWTRLSKDEDDNLASLAEKLQMELTPTRAIHPPWSVTFAEGSRKLMLSMHHSLYDAMASEILLNTVAKLYEEQAVAGSDSVLQLERGMELGLLPTASQRNEASSLWNTHLADLRKTVGALNAPFPDLTQSRQKQTQRILSSKRVIPPAFTSASPALPTLLQSSFGCILASYLELKAVMFGQVVSQRILHPDLPHVMGPAMATIPVVVRGNASSAEELWSEMARDTSKLFRSAHSLHPVDIKKMLNESSGSSNAPFPGLFVYHPATEDNTTQNMFKEEGQALSLNVEHPLALNIFEADGTIELTGDGRRISQEQLDLMMSQIIGQAQAMLESPRLPLEQLQNTMDRSLISVSGQATSDHVDAVNPTGRLSLHASEHPEWIAAEEVIFQESDEDQDEIVTKTITYAQLDSLTNAIVSKLASHEAGLRPDDVVALYMNRDLKSLATTLAIFRAGYIYLPVDEELPLERKRLLIRDANARLVVSTDELIGGLDLNLDGDPAALLIPDLDAILSWPVSQGRLEQRGDGGYLLYTSGSTGRPKGVRVSNKSLCHFIASFSARLTESSSSTANLGGVGKYLNLTSRAFDPHLTQLFVPWHLGYRVVIGQDRTAMIGSMKEVINELGVTHFGSVPSVLTQLGLRPEQVPSVKVVTTGGEKASSELLDLWSSRHEGQQHEPVLFNFYGPTEVTIGCLGHAVNHDSNARNLGLPLKGLEVLLLCPDTGDRQVIAKRGQPGELCIAGPQVAMGYLDRPIENAKSFQTTTLLGGGEKRMYRTGDMMRMMHDGTLEFLGRADQQAKIRGQRLELDEVVSFLKAAVAGEGDLDFAATVAGNGTDSSQQLLAFVARKATSLLKGEIEADVEPLGSQSRAMAELLERIHQKCEDGLPAFMVPALHWVSRIPYLPASGKVDTKALAKLATDILNLEDEPASPNADNTLSVRESTVVKAVEEAVGVTVKATATSSIHRLGIDSLSAVHLLSLLRTRGFPNLKMAEILSSSCTVGSLARLADQDSSVTTTDAPQEVNTTRTVDLVSVPDGLSSEEIEAVLPCLPLQSALVARSLVWLSANSEGDEHRDVPYVAQFHYRLSHGTDVVRWKESAERVVASEAMLRTCFVQRDDGRILQVVLKSPPSPFDSGEDRAEIVAKMNVRPPIRLQIGETNDSGETVVSLKIHHALFDGVAIDVLRNRLEQSYNGQDPADSTSLRVLTGLSNHCNLSEAQIYSTKRSWQAKLRGVRPCRVGADNNNSGAMARSTLHLGYTVPQLKAKLQAQATDIPVSVSSVFQLATALCLAQVTRQTSIIHGFVMSLRPLLDHVVSGVDEFVGPCLNTLIQSLNLQSNETLPALARRVHEAHIDACQDAMPLVGVEMVQRWAGSEDKLFDSLLSINVVPDQEAKIEPGQMSLVRIQSKSDLALAIDVDLHADGKISLTFSSGGVLTESQLDDIGQLFERIVGSSADENARVEDFVSVQHASNTAAPMADHSPAAVESEPASTDTDYQEALACVKRIVSRLLHLKPADISDKTSLYQIGLDSITILPFVKLVNREEKIKLSPDAVIKARTIQGTARLVQKAKTEIIRPDERQDTPAAFDNSGVNEQNAYDRTLQRLAKDLMFVATPLQEGMLSASLAIENKAYTYVHTIQLSERALAADTPSLDNFFAAFNDTVQACEILRTRFVFTEDDEAPWVGLVSPTEQSDLVSCEVVKTGRIQLKIHHALYDATSIQALWHILGENYRRRLQGHDQEPALYLFRPFAKTVASAQKASVAFWNALVQDYRYTPLEFPQDSLQASSAFHFTLGEQDLSLLQTRCRELSVTVKAALQLAWVKVLCEAPYRQGDVVFGEVVTTGGGFVGDALLGPTINTVPMRVNLADQGIAVGVAEALARVQRLNDDVKGDNSMASLRKVQTLWRSSNRDVPVSLFQSLFVFDGVVDSAKPGNDEPLFKPARTQAEDNGPAYDEYPLIASFQIKNNTLRGKLRTKMAPKEAGALGSRLEAAVRSIILGELERPALDVSLLKANAKNELVSNTGAPNDKVDLNGLTPTADAVLELVKKVLDTRCKGKHIDYDTNLVNVGLDSILAIRLSKLLRKKMGITMSVFDIIKGASARDMAKRTASTPKVVAQKPTRQSGQEEEQKELVAKHLGLAKDQVDSVLPTLAGQRAHLEQWLHSGKRFFEAPWVYRVQDSIDAQRVASSWVELCQVHETLRTTFIWTGKALVQVTLAEKEGRGFTALQNLSKPINDLIEEHVGEENGKPTDFRQPPARLSFLEASDGKAVVLRLHHALYDAWSIKMIEKDLNDLLAVGKVPETRVSLGDAVGRINDIRQPDAEDAYWKDHLSSAQDTVLASETSPSKHKSPLSQHFKASYPDIIPRNVIKRNTRTSAAILLAYAKALGHVTKCSRPMFGLNHASRSLSSADGTQTLDLTAASVPTLTVTPCCVDLESENSLDSVQDHLAQLAMFAQADGVHSLGPKFNSYLNIIYAGESAKREQESQVLSRLRLDEPLASDYFTVTKPSLSTVSTIDGLETSHLCPHQFFFTVSVGQDQDVRVSVSGSDVGDGEMVAKMVSHFGSELEKLIEGGDRE